MVLRNRLIPVLLLNEGQVVQTKNFRLTNLIHSDPAIAADHFYHWAADEIIVLDVTRDRSKREKFYRAVRSLAKKCFVPLAVGGWIDNLEEAKHMMDIGVEKIIINTEAFRCPAFITECAKAFGSQAVVISIDVKGSGVGCYSNGIMQVPSEVYIDRGNEATWRHPLGWAIDCSNYGAGELFVNSIDNDGTQRGYNLDIIFMISINSPLPVIAMGGVHNWQHLVDGLLIGKADAVAVANFIHYQEHALKHAKRYMIEKGCNVRRIN